MAFVFVLTDLAGVARSELAGAKGKSLTTAVGSLGTASVQVRLDHEDADFLLEGDALLKVYETHVPGYSAPLLHLHARLISAEEVADAGADPSVQAAFADPFWVLTRRLIGQSGTGYVDGTAVAPKDRTTLVANVLAAANTVASGVKLGTTSLSGGLGYVGPWQYKPAAEAIAEIAATLDGPDWKVTPIERDASGNYGQLDVKASISTFRPDAVFEYGSGLLNVKSYRRVVSLEGTANRVFHLPSGFPDTATQGVLMQEDTASQTARGLLESVVAGDLTVDQMRVALLQHHIAVRKGPRQTITFDPVSDLGNRVPRLGVDYNVGDIVPFRASIVRKKALVRRINVNVRIYQVALSVDEAGSAAPTLTVTPTT